MTGCAGQPNTKLLLEGHAGCHHAINGECTHTHTHTQILRASCSTAIRGCCLVASVTHATKKAVYRTNIHDRKAALTWESGFCPCCWGSSAPSAEKGSAQPDLRQPICSSSSLMTMIDVPPDPWSAETHAWKAAPWAAQDLHTKNSKPSIVCAVHSASKLASYRQMASHTLKLPVSSVRQYLRHTAPLLTQFGGGLEAGNERLV